MNLLFWTTLALILAGALVVRLEKRGRLASPVLEPPRDARREAYFLVQYGQFSSLVLACAMVLTLDGAGRWHRALALVIASLYCLGVTHAAKRFFGRIRPGRERDGLSRGAFLGPTWRRLSWRESFPSSHAAAAFAMSTVLYDYYPDGALVWWTLAGGISLLRWLLDAHWLSDVLVGGAFGIACGLGAVWTVGAIA